MHRTDFFNYSTLYEYRAKLTDGIIKLKKKSLNPSFQKDNIKGISLAYLYNSDEVFNVQTINEKIK